MPHILTPHSQNEPSNNTDPRIRIVDISKVFPCSGSSENSLVLENISFEVSSGEVLAIIGKSGSGKSTLLDIICGATTANTGSIVRHGAIGYVPQNDTLLPWRTVLDNILLPAEIKGADPNRSRVLAFDLLRNYGLESFSSAYPSELSGGMKQKTALIRLLVHNPDIFVFDESFSALDFSTRLQTIPMIRTHARSFGKAVVCVTRDIEEAIALADRILVLGGRPAHITYQTTVAIPEHDRDPVSLRTTGYFSVIFRELWHALDDTPPSV